jgi:hypothetical protein
MLIYKYNIPDKLIFQYCKVIIELEKNFSTTYESARSEIHNEIFAIAGRSRALEERCDRIFNTELNKIIVEICFCKSVKYIPYRE